MPPENGHYDDKTKTAYRKEGGVRNRLEKKKQLKEHKKWPNLTSTMAEVAGKTRKAMEKRGTRQQ